MTLSPQPRSPQNRPSTAAGWSQEIHRGFFPLDLHVVHPEAFQARSVTKVRQGCHMARIRASAHVARMRQDACDRLLQPCVKALWLHDGEAAFRQGHQAVTLQGGQWLLYEASRPYELDMAENADFTVLFSHITTDDSWLQRGFTRRLTPRPVEEAASLALDMVNGALREGLQLQASTQAAFALSLRALLDAALTSGATPSTPRGTRPNLLQEAQAYLLAHLTDARLSSEELALRLGVSRRSLYKAFEAVNDTPQSFQLTQRLLRCRERLQAPQGDQLNLTHLAYEHGFGDAAHFSRAYKRLFGESPSASRQHLQRGKSAHG
ncbi:helix-turn-helix domain-containing protein [Aquabacterium sp.]|uniref:helix-turn-helix domain-containing protein n=1 Tax=Aquabacterium sp. TaxID=1872578 RepID=UPI0025B91CE2|nr:helix-turn-helix domain-containing protein [Aquabacterium sp.]